MSVTDNFQTRSNTANNSNDSALIAAPMTTSAPTNNGTLDGLDRKAMEQERLARIAARKRKASLSPPPFQRAVACQDKKPKISVPSSPGSKRTMTTTSHEPVLLEFPQGVVKRTWAKGYPRNDDIKIEEVLRKSELNTAVLSSFMWDPEWIFRKIDTARTNMVLVMQAKTDREREQHHRDAAEQEFRNLRLCFPPLEGAFTCMHSKLMLLFYSESLRIVVPTANLTEYDWGETGVMENSVFLIDLPRRKNRDQGTKEELSRFGSELMYFLERMGLQESVRSGVLNFDFSNTAHLAFVHSVFGPHYDNDLSRTGYPGLSRALGHLGLKTQDSLELDIVSSSIGSLTDLTINNIYEAARGSDVISSNREKLKAPNAKTKSKVRVFFPTHDTVSLSRGGCDSAGTICLQEKYYNKIDFPRSIFRDYRSTRQGLLSHNKLIFARGFKSMSTDIHTETVAWMYIGSANLSESAWGRLVQDRRRKVPKLTCNNWECGVVLSVAVEKTDPLGKNLRTVFGDIVDVPFEYPGHTYGDYTPWYFMAR
jgi:hypothetical protein